MNIVKNNKYISFNDAVRRFQLVEKMKGNLTPNPLSKWIDREILLLCQDSCCYTRSCTPPNFANIPPPNHISRLITPFPPKNSNIDILRQLEVFDITLPSSMYFPRSLHVHAWCLSLSFRNAWQHVYSDFHYFLQYICRDRTFNIE